MKSKFRFPSRFSLCSYLTAAALIPSISSAGDYTWDGDTSGSWIVGTNWVGNPNGSGVPTHGVGSIQTFYNTGATNLSTFLGAGRNVGTLKFDANADSDVTIRLATTAAGTTIANLTMDVTSGNAAIDIDSGAAGNFLIGVTAGSMVLNDNLVITHNGSGNLTINRPISSGTGLTTSLTKDGTGTLTLTAANNFTGGFILNAGTLNINGLNSLGGTAALPSTVTINGGTIDNTSGAAITISTKLHAYAFNGDFSFKGTNALNLSTGNVNLGTASGTTRKITTTAGTLTIEGVISDGTTANSLIKDGAGTLTLAGANAYTGTTVIKAGSLKINTTTTISTSSSIVVGDTGSSGAVLNAASAGFTVGSAQTLSGIGKVLATGQTVLASGTISAGDSSVGTLSFDGGALTLDSTSKFTYALGTSSDLVSLLNSVTLNLGSGTLGMADFAFSNSGGFGPGIYTLISGASSFTGSLDSGDLAGSVNGFSSTLSMSGNNLILTASAVPEPNAAAMLGGLGLLALLRRRR
ncbi:MAG: autotransporter-associated beta strand repeat-containing protein [Akkermansiaceae bacterium]